MSSEPPIVAQLILGLFRCTLFVHGFQEQRSFHLRSIRTNLAARPGLLAGLASAHQAGQHSRLVGKLLHLRSTLVRPSTPLH